MSAPAIDDPLELSAVEVVEQIARGRVTAEEIAQRSLARARELESLNTLTWIDEAGVLAAARASDRRRARGPLEGLPLIVKDNIDVAGTPSAAGSPALKDNIAPRHAPVVQRLLAAGATVEPEWVNAPESTSPLTRRMREDARMRTILARSR